jgi:DNA-binding CsgD family transcriptional regulator
MSLRHGDYKRIFELVDIAYSIPDRGAMFQTFCEYFKKLVPIDSAAYAPAESKTPEFEMPGGLTFQLSMLPLYLFVEHFAPLHPYHILVSREGVTKYMNRGTNMTDFVKASHLSNTEYGQDFQPVAGVFYEMCTMLGSQGDSLGTMGFHRKKGERDFSDREKKIFNLVLPHIARSFHRLELTQGRIPSTDVGEIVLGPSGTPLSLNEEAKRLLNGCPPHIIPDPDLSAGSTFFSTHTDIYRVRTLPHRPTLESRTVFLERLPPQQLLRSKLSVMGLTRRQAEIAVFATQGLSNREIADRLFITEQTVKDHLHDVFNHLKITRRSELTVKVLALCPETSVAGEK